MNRQEDLSKVFDRTWTANHNDVAKRGREKEKAFINKMFGGSSFSSVRSNIVTPSMRAEKLQRRIDSVNNIERQNKVNNILKKWK